MKYKQLIYACTVLFLSGCSSTPRHELKIAATPIPHAQMLEFIKPDLQEQGIDLKIIVTENFNMPNRALARGEINANFFQHLPFLEEQIKEFHYPIESIANIEIEPMGLYSKKLYSLAQLPDGATIAISNLSVDTTRALMLLQAHDLIQLDASVDGQATVLNITENPKQLKFVEMDPAALPHALPDVDAAIINTNFALEAGLNPTHDALIVESKDSPYVNVLVVRTNDANQPDIQALKREMTSEKMKEFILNTYHGAVLPAF